MTSKRFEIVLMLNSINHVAVSVLLCLAFLRADAQSDEELERELTLYIGFGGQMHTRLLPLDENLIVRLVDRLENPGKEPPRANLIVALCHAIKTIPASDAIRKKGIDAVYGALTHTDPD